MYRDFQKLLPNQPLMRAVGRVSLSAATTPLAHAVDRRPQKAKAVHLTRDEEDILAGKRGDTLSKLLELLVRLGDSFGADRLLDIESAHTVLTFGFNFIASAADILRKSAEEGLKVKVPTTANPIVDMSYAEELKDVFGLFEYQERLVRDLGKIGVRSFTCTPYLGDNRPRFGEHCAWAESSAVVYLNSVLGARSNREGGIVDIASAITGKTPNHGMHLDENRKGQVLFEVELSEYSDFDLTLVGLLVGEVAGSRVPVIDGLSHISFDGVKNLGAASAATGAVSLIHIPGVTAEAKTLREAFQDGGPEQTVRIDRSFLEEMREKFSAEPQKAPQNIAVGCPHLSVQEALAVVAKLKDKTISQGVNFWICAAKEVIEEVQASKYADILEVSGAKMTTLCPVVSQLRPPLMTNSGKACFYAKASLRDLDVCIEYATGEGK